METDNIYSDNGHKGGDSETPSAVIYLPDGRCVPVPDREAKNVDRRHPRARPRTHMPLEIAAREFPDGTRLRVVYDPKDPSRTMFAIWRNGLLKFADRFEYGLEECFPLKPDDPLVRNVVIPSGVQPHDAPGAMARRIGGLLNQVMPLSTAQQLVLGAFGVLTWVSEGLPFAPTVGICGPRDVVIPVLQALSLFCRNAMVVGDVTPAGLLEACLRVKPTLLIIDFGLRQDALRLLEMGSRPGISSLQKRGGYSACCPRVIACSDASINGDLLGGGILMSLPLLGTPDVGKLYDSGFLERAEGLRQQLLGYDLESGGIIRPLKEDLPGGLRPGEREAFRCWAAPFADEQQFLRELFDAMQCVGEVSANRLPVDQYATLSALYSLAHKRASCEAVGEVATIANKVLEQMGEEIRQKDRKVGANLTRLGFPRRERGGDDGPYQVEFTMDVKRLIHQLVQRYGAWTVEVYTGGDQRVMCPLCREFKLCSAGELKYYEEVLKPAEERRKRKEEKEWERHLEQLRKNPDSCA